MIRCRQQCTTVVHGPTFVALPPRVSRALVQMFVQFHSLSADGAVSATAYNNARPCHYCFLCHRATISCQRRLDRHSVVMFTYARRYIPRVSRRRWASWANTLSVRPSDTRHAVVNPSHQPSMICLSWTSGGNQSAAPRNPIRQERIPSGSDIRSTTSGTSVPRSR